jgi:hypothetical protein
VVRRVATAAASLLARPWVITALLCAALLALPMVGADVAAQEFRTWLFRTHGPVLWQDQWYGGHLQSGYSLLFPPLAALLGTRVVGVLASVWAAAAGSVLIGTGGRPQRLAAMWFALACVGEFVQGQLPFMVGLALALSALVEARRGRVWLAGAAALAASLASPLAGAFLLLAALAWWPEAGLRRIAPLAAAGGGVGLGSVLGGGGWFPFPPVSLATVLLFCGGGLILTRRSSRTLRWALVLYALSSVLLFVIPNPAGGNAARLGALAGGPVAALALGQQRRWRAAAVVAVPLLLWQAWPVAAAVSHAADDPSSQPAYYTGLQSFLRTQDPTRGRLEVPTLRQHWEASYVAPGFPLARGWERQLDLEYNPSLYRPDLTGEQLHDWAVNSGVALVALPDAPLDPWSKREGELLAAGQPWLTPVWHDAHWQVWRVTDAPGLVLGPARLTRLGINVVDLAVDTPGDVVVRLHWSPYWQVIAGSACLRPGPDGWLVVRAGQPGPVTLAARWSLAGMAGGGAAACSSGQ